MLKKEEYITNLKREIPVFYMSLIQEGPNDNQNYHNLVSGTVKIENVVYTMQRVYYSIFELERCRKNIFKEWSDTNAFEKSRNELLFREQTLLESVHKNLEEFCTAYERYVPSLHMIFSSDALFETALRSALQKVTDATEVDTLMDQLNVPLSDNFFKQEEYDLVHTSDLEAHIAKYSWILSRYGDEKEYTVKNAQDKLATLKKEEFISNWDTQKNIVAHSIERAKQLLEGEAHLVDIFQFIIYFRTQRTDVLSKAAFFVIPLLQNEAKKHNLSYRELLSCTSKELLDNNVPTPKKIQERMKDFTMVLDEGVLSCYSGPESRALHEYFKEDEVIHGVICGTIACKGLIRGTVKVIESTADFSKIQKGDVLVASMTTPIMLPIMKLASAFVTDEGGVTCHAAIISRELKKPCIIGTKIATKVLKSGDEIEVDAEKGIVKIIERIL